MSLTVEGVNAEPTIVGTDNNDDLPGTDQNNIIDAKAGDDLVSPEGGQDLITLGAGKDILHGSPSDLAGDHVTDFEPLDDKVVFANPDFEFANIKSFDADASGLSILFGDPGDLTNGLRLDGDFTNLGVVYTHVPDGSEALFDKVIGDDQLNEGQKLDSTIPLGTDSLADLLNPEAGEDFTITLQNNLQAAAFNNSLIAYQVNEDRTLTHVQLLAANVKTASGPLVYANAIEGLEIGFAVVQKGGSIPGFTNASGIDLLVPSSDTFHFKINGVDQSLPIFFSHDDALNPDGLDHVVVGAEDGWTGAAVFGFEDLVGGGDADYQDVVFTLKPVQHIDTPI